MKPDELRAIIKRLGLTQEGFARLVRVDPSTCRRWLAGLTNIPGPVTVLVPLLLEKAENTTKNK